MSLFCSIAYQRACLGWLACLWMTRIHCFRAGLNSVYCWHQPWFGHCSQPAQMKEYDVRPQLPDQHW